MAANEKTYLGDSVYAVYDGCAITLTTENGDGPSNTIVMEPEVFAAMFKLIDSVDKPVERELWAKDCGAHP